MSDSSCGCVPCGDVHPDLVRSKVVQAAANTRYYITSQTCYLKYLHLSADTQMKVRVFTTEDPDDLLADDNRATVSTNSPTRDPDAPPLLFEHGIYIETEGTAGDTCIVEVDFIPRKDYCCAFHRTEDYLDKCWDEAAGRKPGERGQFAEGVVDEVEWENDGAAAGGGGAAGGSDAATHSVKKDSAGTIDKGDVVYSEGYSSGITVELADGDDATKRPPLGIASGEITDAVAGDVVISGIVEGLDTSSYTKGDFLYLSETAGALTATIPEQERVWRMAVVEYSHATEGVIRVGIEEVVGLESFTNTIYGHNDTSIIQKGALGFTLPYDLDIKEVQVRISKAYNDTDADYWTVEALYAPPAGTGTPTSLQTDKNNTSDTLANRLVATPPSAIHETLDLTVNQNLARDKGDHVFVLFAKSGTPATSLSSNAFTIVVKGTRRF